MMWKITFGIDETPNLKVTAEKNKNGCATITVEIEPESKKTEVLGYLYTNDDRDAEPGEIPVARTNFVVTKRAPFKKSVCAYVQRGLEISVTEE